MGNIRLVEKRRENREQIVGDIFWKHYDKGSAIFYDGAVMDVSKSGLSIVTHMPLKEGSRIWVYGEGILENTNLGRVCWCGQMEPGIYRSGLSWVKD